MLRWPCALLLAAASSVAAAETIYSVNTTGATETGSKNNAGVYIGQSFNSGTNTLLTTASLQINSNALTTGTFNLNLHLATGSSGNYTKTGDSLFVNTYSNSILSTSLDAFYTFNNLNWALTPNTVYMIGIPSETVASVKWTLNQSGTKDSSTGFITGYSGYNSQAGSSIDNGLHGATITAVPEPSGLAAASIATAGLWLLARRRRACAARS